MAVGPWVVTEWIVRLVAPMVVTGLFTLYKRVSL